MDHGVTPAATPTPALPAMDRLRLRILAGSLEMLAQQLAHIDDELLGRTDPALDAVRVASSGYQQAVLDWKARVLALHGSTVDAEPPAARTRTMGDDDDARTA